jgi:hypothetical protein
VTRSEQRAVEGPLRSPPQAGFFGWTGPTFPKGADERRTAALEREPCAPQSADRKLGASGLKASYENKEGES